MKLKFYSHLSILSVALFLNFLIPASAEGPEVAHEANAPGAEGHASSEEKIKIPSDKLPTDCVTSQKILEDIRSQLADIESKKKELAEKEAELKSKDKMIQEQIAKIEEVRADLLGAESSQQKDQDSKVAKLVETVESMAPKAAAQLLAQVDERLAVKTAEKISTPKLAKIMNLMDLSKSSKLAEGLAGVARAKRLAALTGSQPQTGPAVATNKKGGEENDQNHNKSIESDSTGQ